MRLRRLWQVSLGGFPSMLLYLLLLPKCPLLFKSSMGSMMTNVVLLLAS